jgi:hypothetical protein
MVDCFCECEKLWKNIGGLKGAIKFFVKALYIFFMASFSRFT